MRFKAGIAAAALLSFGALLAGCGSAPLVQDHSYRKQGAPIYSIAAFDPARLPGTWTEVASFAPEGARCRPGSLTIRQGAGGLQASGRLCRAGVEVGQGGTLSPIGPGRLWLSGADEPLWVVWVDTDYRTLVLGTPSGHFGWILNRGGALPPDRMKAAREILEWNGYDLTQLRFLFWGQVPTAPGTAPNMTDSPYPVALLRASIGINGGGRRDMSQSDRGRGDRGGFEWPTLVILVATYAVWAFGTVWLWPLSPFLSIATTALAITQFSSLQHEVLHGHPFGSRRLNEALVFPGLTLFVPYIRFRDTHLAHHHDPSLTDPYDDPESNYLDPAVWAGLSRPMQRLLRLNNTLLGRMLLGPIIGTWSFCKADWAAIRGGDRVIRRAWIAHAFGVALVLLWQAWVATMPVWAWILAAYLAYAILKIRTFLEHRAHELHRARSVVVEDRGPLALLFLNNNLHVVHHMHPQVPWYRLPGLYAARRAHFLRRNEGYVYASYGQVFRQYLLRTKDPVPHPVWPVRKDG